jgi:hypothetical protein
MRLRLNRVWQLLSFPDSGVPVAISRIFKIRCIDYGTVETRRNGQMQEEREEKNMSDEEAKQRVAITRDELYRTDESGVGKHV